MAEITEDDDDRSEQNDEAGDDEKEREDCGVEQKAADATDILPSMSPER